MWFEWMQFLPSITPRSCSTPDSIVISPLPPSFLLPLAVISNFLLSSFENRNDNDDENEVNGGDGWNEWWGKGIRKAGDDGGREAEEDGGRGWTPEGRECKILQPRGTHGDVISTTEPETYYNSHNPPTTKSLGFHVWMAHSPWFVSRKVYLFWLSLLLLHTPRPRVPAADSRASASFLHTLFHSPTHTDSWNKDFISR